jgi:hypothetical protein
VGSGLGQRGTGRRPGEQRMPAPRWCPSGLTKTQERHLQKLRLAELMENQEEEERDCWFNQARPVVKAKKTWREKCLAREENNTDSDTSTSKEGSDEDSPPKAEGEEQMSCSMEEMEVNMVFTILGEFHALGHEAIAMALGPKKAVFDKPGEAGRHMRPLFIKGHINSKPVGRMMVDGGASVNIMSNMMFEKLGHREEELKQTNLSLSGFLGEPAEARGILSAELTVRSKTLLTAFFVVEVKGRYNVLLLGRD